MLARIKKNDTVVVLFGKDKGKQGRVVECVRKNDEFIVEGLAINIKHVKARKQGEVAGVKKMEGYILGSKVALWCSVCKKPARVNVKTIDTDKRIRVCNRCKETI